MRIFKVHGLNCKFLYSWFGPQNTYLRLLGVQLDANEKINDASCIKKWPRYVTEKFSDQFVIGPKYRIQLRVQESQRQIHKTQELNPQATQFARESFQFARAWLFSAKRDLVSFFNWNCTWYEFRRFLDLIFEKYK